MPIVFRRLYHNLRRNQTFLASIPERCEFYRAALQQLPGDTTLSAFVSHRFTPEATDRTRALYRLGSDATNERFACVNCQWMRDFSPLRCINHRVTRRS